MTQRAPTPMVERAAKAIYFQFIRKGPLQQRRDGRGNPVFVGSQPDYETPEECLERRWHWLSDIARDRWRAEAEAALANR